ncbi:HD domain-containing protein [Aminiphilus sp.]|uniref:CCA tRNA nucleotidyltransferase n=1 Tax=Aminiphilus sp. TaxID=1872488 RepID=UPI00262C5CEE|nr:HD domain-containing protein [Aminiphilus sp.]
MTNEAGGGARMKERLPSAVHALWGFFAAAGIPAWIVGGCVRDLLLGRSFADVDFVADAPAEVILALVEHWGKKRFGRFEGTLVGKPPAATVLLAVEGTGVEIAPLVGGSLEADLGRRDFTVNAMAMDLKGALWDPFGGRGDLKEKRLRFTGSAADRLAEDPIRALRFCRFAAELAFHPDLPGQEAVRALAPSARGREKFLVASERVGREVLKALSGLSVFLELADALGMLPFFLPFLESLKGVEQSPDYHPEGDVFVHTLRTVRAAEEYGVSSVTAAALLHDLGKPETFFRDESGRIRFFRHEERSAEQARRILTAWAWPGVLAEETVFLVARHDILRHPLSLRGAVRLLRELEAVPRLSGAECSGRAAWQMPLEHLVALTRADIAGGNGNDAVLKENLRLLDEAATRLETVVPPGKRRLLSGHDVMQVLCLPPGPKVGELLEELDLGVAEGRVRTREDALAWLDSLKQESANTPS